MPLISVVIPAKGRPLYTRDAVFSAMHQDFDDFDLTLSNNGADPAVKAAVAEFMSDPRFHYIEQPSVLEMSSHWDVASRAATGDYLLILTNRSVLKRGSLRQLADFLRGASADVELVSWGWDSYDNDTCLLSPCRYSADTMVRLNTSEELLKFAGGTDIMHHVYTLPGGANSCVSRALVDRIRHRQGAAFRKMDPGLTFAFSCLLNASELIHFGEALHIAQGKKVSNGEHVVRGDFQEYMNSLGLAAPWRDVPVNAPLVVNAIARDFLTTLTEYGRDDIRAEWNRAHYYFDCLGEIRNKRKAGILSNSEIGELKMAVDLALQSEDERVRASVAPPFARKMLRKANTLAKIVVTRGADLVRLNHRGSGGEKIFQTAIEAAGFVN